MSLPGLRADWPAPKGVQGFTTLRHGAGASVAPFDGFNLGNFTSPEGDSADVVRTNRAELVDLFALPAAPRWLRQVHGTAVVRMQADPVEGEPEADAAVTSEPGVVLAVLTADCLPVLFCSRDGREVAAAHAGWRGLADGVLEATLAAMRTPSNEVMAWLGPAAGPERYEVGIEVYDAMVSRDWAAGSAFRSTRPGHWTVDLYALARQRLEKAGMRPDAIHGGGLCTIAEPDRFFSHRRDRRSGRMATVIWTLRD